MDRDCPRCQKEVAADGTCLNADCLNYNKHVHPPLKEEESDEDQK